MPKPTDLGLTSYLAEEKRRKKEQERKLQLQIRKEKAQIRAEKKQATALKRSVYKELVQESKQRQKKARSKKSKGLFKLPSKKSQRSTISRKMRIKLL
jgi:hypothetical protein